MLPAPSIAALRAQYPLIERLSALQPVSWFNPAIAPAAEALADVGLDANDVAAASARLARFAPFLARAFPETQASGGVIESPLVPLPAMQAALAARLGREIPGTLWLKQDSHLPISGSIKARGGIYEVLKHAEGLALDAGLVTQHEDYGLLASEAVRGFFGQYAIAVGSTGNLGLSIGIMGARLGFRTTVHMSADARQWKKDKLREHGVTVIEYASDYSVAVEQGRRQAEDDPACHFVDDENSHDLFLGYAVAGERLKQQFDAHGVLVDAGHPLFVYLPCGVGGGPGGVAFGLKLAFGDHVHCVFAEPTHSPCMLLGVHTGLHELISVQDIGIDNITAADGLAVGRPSGFVGRTMQRLIDGYATVSDEELYRLLALLQQTEGWRLEPSAVAGFAGILPVLEQAKYASTLVNATHLVWGTGGSMVPEAEMDGYVSRGQGLMASE